MQLLTRKLDELVPYENNPRKNDHAVETVATAIREFGFRVPILIRSNDQIVDGHLRYKAAKVAGLVEVPCMLADDMSEAQIKAFRISVNKVAELATWDEDLLRQEIIGIDASDFDVSLLPFSEKEIDGLLVGVGTQPLGDMPFLPSGDRDPVQQMTFTLHDDQAALIKATIKVAHGRGAYVGTGNDNKNGNALARICAAFVADSEE